MTADALWESAWVEAFEAETDRQSEYPPALWRAGGRVSKDKPNKEDGTWWRANGAAMVQSYIDWRKSSPWSVWTPEGVPAIELLFDVELGGIHVKGAIDRVFVTDIGELVVVDLKTGAAPDNNMQLGLYATALEIQYGTRPEWGSYFLARKGELTAPSPLGHYSKAFFDNVYSKFQIARKHEIYLPKLSGMCISCGVSDYCRAYGGAKADLIEESK